ncbi:esterase-like activity of phytase family protein, partial [Caulobacter sp. HMWF025]|uniref:esterase-like activity of phytase family protein n=2 Tax=unclassified Caulobacter TaxID=2648921 RepID=UPI0018EEAA0A
GVSITPDGKYLAALLQSATVQDSASGKDADQSRANTRLFVYDIGKTATPTAPVAEYVVQLPVFRNKGDGAAPDKTAAQSEILALSDHQFLVLARDGNGRGGGATRPAVYRSVLLVETAWATNIAGSAFETSTLPVAPEGVLNPGVTPARQTELVNLINPVQLARFGLNLDNAAPTPLTLPEKFEALALVPALDPKAPNDAFLFIGSDNDFQTATGIVGGIPFDAGIKAADGTSAGDNDNLVLVYRLTLPGWSPSVRK